MIAAENVVFHLCANCSILFQVLLNELCPLAQDHAWFIGTEALLKGTIRWITYCTIDGFVGIFLFWRLWFSLKLWFLFPVQLYNWMTQYIIQETRKVNMSPIPHTRSKGRKKNLFFPSPTNLICSLSTNFSQVKQWNTGLKIQSIQLH